jgi:hypothetical protein
LNLKPFAGLSVVRQLTVFIASFKNVHFIEKGTFAIVCNRSRFEKRSIAEGFRISYSGLTAAFSHAKPLRKDEHKMNILYSGTEPVQHLAMPIIVDKGAFATIREAAFAEQEIDWWDESNPQALHCTQCFAAVELRSRLCLLTGVDEQDERYFPLRDTDELEDMELLQCDSILVGTPASSRFAQQLWDHHELARRYEWDSLSAEGFCAVTVNNQGGKLLLLAGRDRVGTLYAVYAFLESLGFRWFGLGEQGMVVPASVNFTLPDTDICEAPRFRTRGCYSEHIDDSSADLTNWMARNRVNFVFLDRIHNPHALKKRGIRLCAGGHNILSRFLNPHAPYPYPPSHGPGHSTSIIDSRPTYFEAHPEWFGLVNGERSANVGAGDREGYGDNYCTTNADATDELCSNVVEDLISGDWKQVDYLNFWMLDNGQWCSCEQCETTGNYAYKMILVTHRLRQFIRQAIMDGRLKRDVKILFPVYHETLPAPDRPLPEDYDYASCYPTYFPIERCYVHRLDDAVCTETNADLMSTYRPWTTDLNRHYRGELYIGEYYNVGAFATIPVPFMTIMKQDIPFYYRTGIRHFHYMHMSDQKWGTLTLTNYQLYRMLWNPELNVEALLDDYFTQYYGEVAREMRHFYESLETAMRNAKFLKHYQYLGDRRLSLAALLNQDAEILFPLKHMQYEQQSDDPNAGISLVQTMDLLAYCRKLIDDALLHAKKDEVITRLLEDEMRFTYLEDMTHYLYYMVRTNRFKWSGRHKLAKRSFTHARHYAQRLEHNTEATKPTGRFKLYDNALKASWCEDAYRNYMQLFGDGTED